MESSEEVKGDDVDVPVVPRRDRIHVLREFILDKFDVNGLRRGFVLDVAGGKGDLSFLLCNADHLQSVVVDPRYTDHEKIIRTCLWHHESRNTDKHRRQAEEGQALARLALSPPFRMPQHLRMFFDEKLLFVLEQQQYQLNAKNNNNNNDDNNEEDERSCWDAFWEHTRQRVQKLEATFPTHRQKKKHKTTITQQQPHSSHIVESANMVWEILNNVTLVIGFHPDEATDVCIDFAIRRRVPFVVCPCCLFSSLFPHRRVRDGKGIDRPVTNYEEYVRYLREKHPRIRVERLPFRSNATGHGEGLVRNTVLYMLPSDYERHE